VLVVDRNGRVAYLCRPCARELEYGRTHKEERGSDE
jgi:hypothetical protein